jgi:alpha-N-arabinofuranosidase
MGKLGFLLWLTLPVAAAAQAEPTATVRIDAGQVVGEISPLLYGQFAEFMFEGVKGGLHAELLRDRSFEEAPNVLGLPRHWERYPDDRNDDFGLRFAWDASHSYPGRAAEDGGREHSLRVDAGPGVIRRHGLYQARVPVREGIEYRGSIWMRSDGYRGRVVVALEPDVLGGEAYAEAPIEGSRDEWTRHEFRVRAGRSDPLARFAVLFEGRGTVWIDQVSLIPGDAVGDVRRDVFERVEALRPAFIRWPGGNVAQDYHWQWGVGPRDRRVTWANLSWRDEPEPSDFGTDEFLALCRRVRAEPSITVNVEGRGSTAEEAAAWVEYCNGPATSKHGALRAANGHAEPYAVRLWELGNEIWGDWVRGHSNAATYAANARRYAAAMRAVDPGIQLIAVGDNNMAWNREVLRGAGQDFDYLAIHHYYGVVEIAGDIHNLMARPLHYERFYREVADTIRELAPGRDIKLAINEWGLTLPVEQHHSMDAALYGARLLNVFERSSEIVAMSAVSDLVNGWPGGIIQAGRHGVFVTPTYLVNQLYAAHPGRERLAVDMTGPTFDSSREGKGVPAVDVVANRSEDGRSLFVKLVNTDREQAIRTTVEVAGADVDKRASVATLRARTPRAFNSFATPDAIRIERSDVEAGQSFVVELPASSVTVLTLNVGRE